MVTLSMRALWETAQEIMPYAHPFRALTDNQIRELAALHATHKIVSERSCRIVRNFMYKHWSESMTSLVNDDELVTKCSVAFYNHASLKWDGMQEDLQDLMRERMKAVLAAVDEHLRVKAEASGYVPEKSAPTEPPTSSKAALSYVASLERRIQALEDIAIWQQSAGFNKLVLHGRMDAVARRMRISNERFGFALAAMQKVLDDADKEVRQD